MSNVPQATYKPIDFIPAIGWRTHERQEAPFYDIVRILDATRACHGALDTAYRQHGHFVTYHLVSTVALLGAAAYAGLSALQ